MGKKKASPEEQVAEYARSIAMTIEKWKSCAENTVCFLRMYSCREAESNRRGLDAKDPGGGYAK